MAARTGMAEIIAELRALCDAAVADYSIDGVSYWTEDQLQEVLDGHRIEFDDPLTARARYTADDPATYDYYFDRAPVERAASGAAVFQVYAAGSAAVGTANYSVNYRAKEITFTSDQGNTRYSLRGRAYDLNGAAAEVWGKKVAHLTRNSFDVKTDGHQVWREQKLNHALKRLAYFEGKSTLTYGSGRLDRTDAY